MKILVLFAIIVMPAFIHAQTNGGNDSTLIINQSKNDSTLKSEHQEIVYTVVEEMPKYVGGEDELMKYLSKNVVYPLDARKNGVTGRVYVNFVINSEGKVTNAKILRGIGSGCDEEALRIVNGMPAWTPGRQNGKPVSVMYNLPLNFSLR
jgi:protein TonB